MRLTFKRVLAVGVTTVAVGLVGAGAGYACDGGGAAGASAATSKAYHHSGGHGLLTATAAYFGISAESLKSQLRAGKTPAEIAPTGKTAAGLADELTGALKAKLDAKVADGRLTQDEETAILAKATPKLQRFVAAIWDRSWLRAKDVESNDVKFGYHHR
jgi:hypothetical protein